MTVSRSQVIETDRQEVEEMRRRYEFIVNTSKENMALINAEYVYEAANNAYCQSHSRTREEIIGSTVASLWGDETFEQVIKQPMERCLAGEEVTYLAWYKHSALGLRCMDVAYYPYYNAENVVTHAVVISRDVTDRELAEQSMHRYAERLEVMHEVDRAVMSAQSSEQIADLALRHLGKLVPSVRSTVVMFEESTIWPENSMSALDDWPAGSKQNTTELTEIGTVRVLAQCGDSPASFEDRNSRFVIYIPLVVQQQLLGALTLKTDSPDGFLDEHREIAREVAYPVALAIQRAQLRHALQRYTSGLERLVAERTKEAERRRRVAEGLRDIVTILNSSRPLEEILEYIVSQGALLLHADGIAVCDTPAPGAELTLRVARSLVSDGIDVTDLRLDGTISNQVMAEDQPIIVTDLAQYKKNVIQVDVPEGEPQSDPYAALLAVPLTGSERKIGAMILKYVTAREITDDDIHLATTLADQVVLAIENARLHNRAEEAAVMEERERLARELHDSVTQLLYSLTLFAEAGRRQSDVGNRLQVQTYLEQIGETAQQALKEMRLLLYELRPLVLEQEGLMGALQRRLDAVEKRAGVEVHLRTPDEDLNLAPKVEEGLYRIVQEALNNALKHAAATTIHVGLWLDNSSIRLEVIDNGLGFDLEEGHAGGGMGLTNMRERAEKLGGALSIISGEGNGTRIYVEAQNNPVEASA